MLPTEMCALNRRPEAWRPWLRRVKNLFLGIVLVSVTASAQRPFGIATVAGTPYDPSGDNGPAALASVSLRGMAFRAGNLYLTDGSRIRKIDPSGTISTVAGFLDPVVHQPVAGFSGDGGPALGARLSGTATLEFDTAGNLYIADAGNSCVRKVSARVVGGVAQPLNGTEIITTVAGMGTAPPGNSGDGGPATSATLNSPGGLAVDPVTGTLYIGDVGNQNVRKVDPSGVITTLAGSGIGGFQDGPAASAKFNFPTGITVDAAGNVYVADVLNNRVRKIAAGVVTTFAGTGTSSAAGNLNEGGAAIAANVTPYRVRFDNGILYIIDSGIGTLRQIDAGTGIVTTIAGSGLPSYGGAFPPVGDSGSALAALLGSGPSGIVDAALDAANNFFIADSSNRRVRFVANASGAAAIFGQTVAAGNIATVSGPPGIMTFSGDGGSASAARLFGSGSLVFDPSGNLYFTDGGNNRVRRIDSNGTITTFAGDGIAGFSGVPGSATAAEIQPGSLAFSSGNLYLTNNTTRVLEDAGNDLTIVTNTSGLATPIPAGPTPAAAARFSAASIVFDPAGNLYVADSFNHRIWKVDTNGIATVVAGGGATVIDGVTVVSAEAIQARLFGPGSLALDASGNLYASDAAKLRILKIAAHGTNQPLDGTETVTIFAGTGIPGFSGDNGPATAAKLSGPGGFAFDTAGNFYFNDGINFRIREIAANGIITTVAGTGVASFSGDGGPAVSAQIRGGALAFDSFGNLYMSDGANQVIRVLDNLPPVVTFGVPVPAPNANGWNNTSVTVPFTASDTGAGVASTNPASPLVFSAEGAAVSGIVAATDRAGNSASSTSPAVKIDETAPVISGMPGAGCSLWPPNGKMVQVATITAADTLSGVDPGSFQVHGASNEPPSAPEISITPNGAGGYVIALQADRLGSGNGRTYTLTATAADLAGNTSTTTSTCVVPHDQGN